MVRGKDTKNINIEVSEDTWTELKIMSIRRKTTLQYIVSEILDKVVSRKKSSEDSQVT